MRLFDFLFWCDCTVLYDYAFPRRLPFGLTGTFALLSVPRRQFMMAQSLFG